MLNGDKIRRVPSIFAGVSQVVDQKGGKSPTSIPCQVIYIHPERRFYTVEFQFPRGRTFRESYTFAGK